MTTNTNTTHLTAAERRCLGNILASGGGLRLTQGRNLPGTLRKSVVTRLEQRGLVVGEVKQCAYQHLGTWYPATVYYATAAGCVAFGSEIARAA